MKLKEVKYNEAVERNLVHAEKIAKQKYQGKPIAEISVALGIRNSDSRFDKRLQAISNSNK